MTDQARDELAPEAAGGGVWTALRRMLLIVGAVLALEGALCAWFAAPGSRLRLWVDFLTVQGIILAILGSFLLVGKPFVAARALGRWGREPGGPSRGERFRWGITMIALGVALFGAATWIWSAAFRG